eukprot:CAMPEP_0119301778 /NCGR_PEP_ID=MMETSP1333-20130426/3510_1 /TAXON_ID=418940 /ORGANISM="Scyphosphaera apsteinii, Strain RCC1455" /LENGTH=111 /DNA_ID=CAMNT_0007303955 /DNA_START=47 /DNA_END=382 /DNA_ORIENTATION=+
MAKAGKRKKGGKKSKKGKKKSDKQGKDEHAALMIKMGHRFAGLFPHCLTPSRPSGRVLPFDVDASNQRSNIAPSSTTKGTLPPIKSSVQTKERIPTLWDRTEMWPIMLSQR